MKKILLISILSLPLVACQPGAGETTAKTLSQSQSTSALGSVTSTTTTVEPSDTGGLQGLAALTPSLGIKNFDQINNTMANVTGIFVNTQVTNKYTSLAVQLPVDNDAKAYTFSAQGAATELAAEYCSVLVTNGSFATQRMAAVGNVNIAGIPTVALLAANKMDVAQKLTAKFWGEGLPNMTPATLAAQQQILFDLMTDLAAGEPNTAATTSKVVMGACTATLSSAQVIMM